MITPPGDRRTFHTVARARATRTRKTPGPTLWLARYSSAIWCLRCPALQSITGTAFAGAQPRPRIAGHAPPPGREPAGAMPQRVVRVQHDPVHAVIRAGQQVPVPLGE